MSATHLTRISSWRGGLILGVALVVCFAGAREFRTMWNVETLYPTASAARVAQLSDYFAPLRGTRADSDVFFFTGEEPGGTVLILGGTHPNEPAGFLSACVLIENLRVTQGRVLVIPRANASAFTCTEPGEAHPTRYSISTPHGPRRFRFGSRFTNPLHQWPDPEVYLHFPSAQRLSGAETRNLNRAYPGRVGGSFTERVACAITSLVKQEHVDLVIDLHEASPEYPVINAIVAHERAADVAALANLMLQSEGLEFSLEPSPANFHGLSHRELGDATGAMAVLVESASIMQGRLRGATTEEKVLSGKDDCYLRAARAGLLRVPYDSSGIPIEVRVGRHLAAVEALVNALSELHPDRAVTLAGAPSYGEMRARGLGTFLDADKTPPTFPPYAKGG